MSRAFSPHNKGQNLAAQPDAPAPALARAASPPARQSPARSGQARAASRAPRSSPRALYLAGELPRDGDGRDYREFYWRNPDTERQECIPGKPWEFPPDDDDSPRHTAWTIINWGMERFRIRDYYPRRAA
jgi:hypothetical protein